MKASGSSFQKKFGEFPEPELVGSLSGNSLPSPQLSNSSTMLVRLTADASLQQDGFLAVVDCPSDSATDRVSQCKACPPGEHDDDSDSSTPCAVCAAGRYSDSPGFAGMCSACPLGSTSLAVGSTSVDNCTTSCAAGIEISDAVLELEFDTGAPQDVSGNGQTVLISSGQASYDDGFGAVRDAQSLTCPVSAIALVLRCSCCRWSIHLFLFALH